MFWLRIPLNLPSSSKADSRDPIRLLIALFAYTYDECFGMVMLSHIPQKDLTKTVCKQ